MKIIMEESQRLTLQRERMTAKSTSADDADISLTGLPDLSFPLLELASQSQLSGKPKLIKRASSRDTTTLTPKRVKPTLSRSLSQRSQLDASLSTSRVREEDHEAPEQRDVAASPPDSGLLLSNWSLVLPNAGDDTATERTRTRIEPETGSHHSDSNSVQPWQASLKKLLATGQQEAALMAAGKSGGRNSKALESLTSRPLSNNAYVCRPWSLCWTDRPTHSHTLCGWTTQLPDS